MKTINLKYIMIGGLGLMLSGLLLASYMGNFIAFIMCYSVLMPIGRGIFFFVPYVCSYEWFPARKGMITGMMSAGVAVGALTWSILSTAIVNPNNISPSIPDDGSGKLERVFPKEVADNVPKMFRMIFVCCAVLASFGIYTTRENPEFVR